MLPKNYSFGDFFFRIKVVVEKDDIKRRFPNNKTKIRNHTVKTSFRDALILKRFGITWREEIHTVYDVTFTENIKPSLLST